MTPEEEQPDLANALKWITHYATLHYMGGAFEPDHMRALANLALAALAGEELPDFEASMLKAREKGRELWEQLGFADDGIYLVDQDSTLNEGDEQHALHQG